MLLYAILWALRGKIKCPKKAFEVHFARHAQCFCHLRKTLTFCGCSSLLACAAFFALVLKLLCVLCVIVLLARPVPVINLPVPALTIYVGPCWAGGGQFVLACAVFLALRPESTALTSLEGISCHLFAEVYFCRPAQCFWPFSPNSRPNSQRESAS